MQDGRPDPVPPLTLCPPLTGRLMGDPVLSVLYLLPEAATAAKI